MTRANPDVVAMRAKGAATADAPRLHLRFDKVVVELIARLKAALDDAVPEGRSLVVTCTAPIRQSGKTAAEAVAVARDLIAKSRGAAETGVEIQGNAVRLRLVKTGASGAAKVIGFVHNRETPAALVFDMTEMLIDALDAAATRGLRAPILANPEGPQHLRSWREAYAAVAPAPGRTVSIVGANGRAGALTD